jgi:hypothetical protein
VIRLKIHSAPVALGCPITLPRRIPDDPEQIVGFRGRAIT